MANNSFFFISFSSAFLFDHFIESKFGWVNINAAAAEFIRLLAGDRRFCNLFCSRSNFSSIIFWFIQQYFHVGCIWVHFHPSFCLLTLRWVQNIYNGAYFERSNVFFTIKTQRSLCFGEIKSEIRVIYTQNQQRPFETYP